VSDIPKDRKYSKTHEWFLADGPTVTIGITQFAADELTDITYVELPAIGTKVTAGEAFGEIESVKATSDIYSAISGEVTAVNEALSDEPGLVNTDPFGQGWMIKVKADDLSPLDALMDGSAYEAMLREAQA